MYSSGTLYTTDAPTTLNKNNIEKINDINPVEYESNIQYSVDKKREIYVDNYSYINELEQDLIYLSRVSSLRDYILPYHLLFVNRCQF